jgi:Asp-tRNA(Asn)/Glu-tRNA(Gln) amidotransferase A subunit family amidase
MALAEKTSAPPVDHDGGDGVSVVRLPEREDEASWDLFWRRFAADQRRFRAFLPEAGRRPRLARESALAAATWPDRASRPPLFAVPVGVKDIFQVAGLATCAGSRLPPSVLAGPEAESVRRLRAAGAVVLGKTVTTEFAYYEPGRTRNPRAPGHTPGGSSSGSAAAVAAGMCPIALGTQTIGSICRPAAFCGVVGFKPSRERVPRAGVIPLSPSLDHVGVLAADVGWARRAAAVLLDDWREVAVAGRRPTLGVPIGPYLEAAEPAARHHLRAVQRRLATAGWPVREVPVMADFAAVAERHHRLVAAEAAQVHERWFALHGDLYRARTADLIARGRSVPGDEIEAARRGRAELRRELEAAMAAAGVDLWLSPAAAGPPPRGLATTGDPVMNLPWTQAGLPTVALPAGRDGEGLPLGVQLSGRFGEDEELLDWAEEVATAVGEGNA